MRQLLFVLAIVLLVAFAGCVGDDLEDDTPDDLADDADDLDDADDGDDADETEPADDSEADDDPDRDTDDDPPPESADDNDDADETEPADDSEADDTDGETPAEPTGELELHHIDVGQADATLLITPDGETVLIDTGDWRQDGEDVIAYLEAHDIDRIDHLIATHAHADHIGGHAAVIEWAETEGEGIGAAYDSGVPHTTQTYERYLDAIEEYDVELLIVEEGDELPLESAGIHGLIVNPPADDSGTDLHYNSISIVFEFGEFRYLLTGDAEHDAEQRMVTEWAADLDADVYQAGHHGSSTSSTQPFMDVVDPDYAIISSDYDSQYGHPHDEILERFAAMGIETYWTGVHGDVAVTTDGNAIDIDTTEAFSTDPADLLEAKPDDTDEPDDADDTNDADDTDDADDIDDTDETDEEELEVGDVISVAELNVDGVSPDEEYIVIENTGDEAVDLGSWQIRDREDGGQVDRGLSPFTFPADYELGPGERVTIWTGDGDTTDTDLYWDYGVNMWRAEGDVIILMNPDGEHVFEYAYGDQS